jgi:hypothetical protein
MLTGEAGGWSSLAVQCFLDRHRRHRHPEIRSGDRISLTGMVEQWFLRVIILQECTVELGNE